MIAFVLKRFAWMVLTLWIVFTLSFFLMRSVPGGPFDGERDLPPDSLRPARYERHLACQPHSVLLQHCRRSSRGALYHLASPTGNATVAGLLRFEGSKVCRLGR